MSVTGTLRRFGKTALAPLARFTTRDRARVVMYHRFGSPESGRGLDVEMLERHLRHLSERFRVVPLSRIVSALRAGRSFEPYTVAITVDERVRRGRHLIVVERDTLSARRGRGRQLPDTGRRGAIELSLTDAQSRRAASGTAQCVSGATAARSRAAAARPAHARVRGNELATYRQPAARRGRKPRARNAAGA